MEITIFTMIILLTQSSIAFSKYCKLNNKLIVNHHTHLKRLTLKGNTACVKRLSEKAKAKIKLPMDRITNLNSMVESKVSFSYTKNMQGAKNYIVFFALNQSKQPVRNSKIIGEGPKGVHFQKRSEFGISRNTKVWGRRRIHNTAFICGKESSKFKIGDTWFEGQEIKNQFQKLLQNLKNNERINNLTTIMSNRNFLIGCYLSIKSKPGNYTNNSLESDILDSMDMSWFDEVIHTFKNGKFTFCPSKRTYIPKSGKKIRSFTSPSFKDKIVQEGMRVLLECIFNVEFRESSHAFRPGRGCHTALNRIKLHFGKSNWFIEGDINQQYSSINHNILVNILRKKIQDEPFLDLVYKYMRVEYGEKSDNIIFMKLKLMQGGLISPILSNIYMHPFDEWMEDILIPKYNVENKKKDFFEHTRMIQQYKSAVDRSISTVSAHDKNFDLVSYVRFVDDFLIGVIGSKETCTNILKEINVFLEKHLSMTLNIDKTRIKHATTEKALFLEYDISCTPKSKIPVVYNSNKRLIKKINRTILNAPIKRIVKKFRLKGFLNEKNQPIRCGRYINMDLWNIVESYKSIEQKVINYYSMADNYGRLAARVHYSLKYSCALTISSKMKLKTMKGAFKRYGNNLTIKSKNSSISYPNISFKRSQKFMTMPNNKFPFKK